MTKLTSPNPHVARTYDNMKPVVGRDMWTTNSDFAVFLPSISAIYARLVSSPNERQVSSLPGGLRDLDFLQHETNLFYYPIALYSSGHSVWDLAQSDVQESMIQQRDKNSTVIVGDSGGYQIATGVLKWPWQKKADQSDADWMRDKDAIRLQILRWLEHSCDYSMVLDVPTGSLLKFGTHEITGENLHPGVKSFRDCLDSSMENHDFFIRNRVEGATRFMNVLQGRTQEEGDIWWDVVKDLPFETWAYSGVQASNFAINLRRVIIMRDNKYLDGRNWIHYLGNGKIKAGCALTTLQRHWRKYINPAVTLSYDAASPFVNVAKGNIYYSWQVNPHDIAYKGGAVPDSKDLKGSTQLFQDWIDQRNTRWSRHTSEVAKRVSVGDICVKGYEDLKFKKVAFSKKELESDSYKASLEGIHGETFRYSAAYKQYLMHEHEQHGNGMFEWGKTEFAEHEKYECKWPSSMDGLSYVLAMSHNVELHIDAIQHACAMQDLPASERKNHISSDLVEFAGGLCEEILTSERPMELIAKHEKMLSKITGMDATNNLPMDLGDFQ
jgi:hypothetical protein